MSDEHVSGRISQLEREIEQLAETVESCRKIIRFSRLAVALGVSWMVALATGLYSSGPLSLIAAIAAVIYGIVGYGSNLSTLRQSMEKMRQAEAARDELIGEIDFETIVERQ
ncbi:MAG TPA: hypothetical protein VKA79_10800 [Aestuariivirgaceae bacterium]|nr:hypothetical protein [Aestuariivirgaceae bacterium]